MAYSYRIKGVDVNAMDSHAKPAYAYLALTEGSKLNEFDGASKVWAKQCVLRSKKISPIEISK